MISFYKKRIWLIGGSEGIGRELTIQLVMSGAYLAISGRNEERLKQLCEQQNNQGIFYAQCDVTNLQSLKGAWAKIKSQWDKLDMLIYCSGTYKPMSAKLMELDEVENMININLQGAYRALSLVIPEFINNHKGHIVLFGSVAGYCGLPNSIGYGESKSGIIHLAENLKCDLSKDNIKVQVINPGFVKTRLTDKNDFKMPGIMPPDKAAKFILKGMATNRFEIKFPWMFSNFLRILSLLPYSIFFSIVGLIRK